jgi:predicted transcriptional regulator
MTTTTRSIRGFARRESVEISMRALATTTWTRARDARRGARGRARDGVKTRAASVISKTDGDARARGA